MDNGVFNFKAEREALVPPMSRRYLARKMGVTDTFLRTLEAGGVRWPEKRRAQFAEIVAAWKVAPDDPLPRKPRKDIGKKHRKFRLKHRRLSQRAMVADMPVPVAHSHHEIIGIG